MLAPATPHHFYKYQVWRRISHSLTHWSSISRAMWKIALLACLAVNTTAAPQGAYLPPGSGAQTYGSSRGSSAQGSALPRRFSVGQVSGQYGSGSSSSQYSGSSNSLSSLYRPSPYNNPNSYAAKASLAAGGATTTGYRQASSQSSGAYSQGTVQFGSRLSGGYNQGLNGPSAGYGQGAQSAGGYGQGAQSAGGYGQGAQSAAGYSQGVQSAGGYGQVSQSAGGYGQGAQSAAGYSQGVQSAGGYGQVSQSAGGYGQGAQSAAGYGQGGLSAGGYGQTQYGSVTEDPYAEPANYEFSYEVNAPESGAQFGHQESRQNEYTRGSYRVLLPDGRTQVVEYEADEDGYRPTVTFQQAAGGYGGNGGYAANGSNGLYANNGNSVYAGNGGYASGSNSAYAGNGGYASGSNSAYAGNGGYASNKPYATSGNGSSGSKY